MTDLLRHACKAAIAVACGALFATSAPAWAEDIDTEALAAVTEHGERLRPLGTFSIDADLVFEEVMETGEKITVIEQVTARIIERSRESRAAYLARIRDAAEEGPARSGLSCSNQMFNDG